VNIFLKMENGSTTTADNSAGTLVGYCKKQYPTRREKMKNDTNTTSRGNTNKETRI